MPPMRAKWLLWGAVLLLIVLAGGILVSRPTYETETVLIVPGKGRTAYRRVVPPPLRPSARRPR